MNITKAQKNDSAFIARLIMTAMTDDCCQNLAGEHKTLEDFAAMMKDLVEMEDSQYSYRNTLIARTDEGEKAGVCVSYKGADLHRLRQRFIEQAARLLLDARRDRSGRAIYRQSGRAAHLPPARHRHSPAPSRRQEG